MAKISISTYHLQGILVKSVFATAVRAGPSGEMQGESLKMGMILLDDWRTTDSESWLVEVPGARDLRQIETMIGPKRIGFCLAFDSSLEFAFNSGTAGGTLKR